MSLLHGCAGVGWEMTHRSRASFALLVFTLTIHACAEPTPQWREALAFAKTLPLADLHFHPSAGLDAQEFLRDMDRAGAQWAGGGAMGPDYLWDRFVRAAPNRFVPFAGQVIGHFIRTSGEAAWTLTSFGMTAYLEDLEADLRAGRFRGIGELHVNNVGSHEPSFPATRYPADSPLMRRLLTLAATYQVPLSVHMDAEPASVAELERLLTLDRKGTVLWAHCGTWADAGLVRRLMAEHPNLFCELSYRDDRYVGPRSQYVPITGFQRRLQSGWKALLEEYSDRFLIGTDTHLSGGRPGWDYKEIIDFFRAVLAQLSPEAARRIGYENARRIFRLSVP